MTGTFFLINFRKIYPNQIDLSPPNPRILNCMKIIVAVAEIEIIYVQERLKVLERCRDSPRMSHIMVLLWRPWCGAARPRPAQLYLFADSRASCTLNIQIYGLTLCVYGCWRQQLWGIYACATFYGTFVLISIRFWDDNTFG